MTRVQRQRCRMMASAMAGVLALLVVNGVAMAGGIPRPPGGTDGRGYELVNIPSKNHQQANSGAILSADGERILYAISGGTSASTTGVGAYLLARRTASGWISSIITPPLGVAIGDYYSMDAVTPDLSAYLATANSGSFNTLGAPTFVRLDENRNQTVLAALTIPSDLGISGDLGASEGLEHVYGGTAEVMDPEHQAGTHQVYDFSSGTPVLISRLPDGSVPLCGTPLGNTDGYLSASVFPTVAQHRISRDGRYTYFTSRGHNCVDPKQIYGYDALTGRTELISGPVTSGSDLGADIFVQAAADGSWVVFRSESSYDVADTNGTADAYRWTRGGSLTCLTCVVPNANISFTDGFYPNISVSEDGSHVYFVSSEELNGEGVAGERNLYVLRANRSLHYIGPIRGLSWTPRDGGELTPDGNVLFFISNGTGLNALSRSDNGGNFAAYRYDDRNESLTCVSCPATGPATSDLDLGLVASDLVLIRRSRAMSDDGSRLFFSTSDALVAHDVNDSWDIYEWHDGEVGLITDGVTLSAATFNWPRIITVSRDGRDFLFTAPAPLTTEVQDQTENIYNARIGGGFAPPPAPPAPCDGDSCQPPPTSPPLLGDLPSELFQGDGQVPSSGGKVRFGATVVATARRDGRLVLSISVGAAGRVSAVARARIDGDVERVGRSSRSVSKAGRIRLGVHLSRAARAQLTSRGRLAVSVDVRFSKTSAPKHLSVVLRVPATANAR